MRYRFGDYTLDTQRYELRRAGQRVPLRPKVFQVLAYLVTHRDRVVTKEELLAHGWPGQCLSDETLTTCITAARQAVGDSGQQQAVIQTRRGYGYGFVAAVEEDAAAPGARTAGPPAPLQTEPRSAAAADTGAVDGAHAVGQPPPAAERRQVTLVFCDLVDSTGLAGQLDPEDYRAVLQAYLEACATVITRFGGNLKLLGDGALVCFGYPQAHDDDPQRAVRAGLGIVAALAQVNPCLAATWGVQLAVRIGVHTGLVVAGDLAVGATHAPQALVGDTPTIAARLQDLAAPNTVVCSAATAHLVEGYVTLEPLGPQVLTGVGTPVPVYRVVGESEAQTRFDVAQTRGLTPLVGREPELALLRERWGQAVEGQGQVVVVNGEPGIGKSRLVQALTAHLAGTAHTPLAYHCSPYYQQTAFYPVVDHLQRLLQLHTDETPEEQLHKLEAALTPSDVPLAEVVPLVAALLALPLPTHYPPLTLTPQRQRHKTLEVLVAWVLAATQQQPVLCVVEDLHWADPTTLEWLGLLVAQAPTARLLLLLVCRPEFRLPWPLHAHLTPVTLRRLPLPQVEQLIGQVAHGTALPRAVVQQIAAKTDGVPLFVEELTKTVLEAGGGQAPEEGTARSRSLPTLAVPATLQDSLMARLDRLPTGKVVAQLGATIGRTFAGALLRAVTPLAEDAVQDGLRQLMEAELVYQHGVGVEATYRFKHALIQDAAYQSLLRSTRQQYHQRVAQVLEAQFPATVAMQPELLAQHYTAAGLHEPAVSYCRQAGAKALARSAYREAIMHFEQALGALQHLLESRAMCEQAIDLRIDLCFALWRLGDWREALDRLREAEALAERLGDQRRLAHVSSEMADGLRILGDNQHALLAGQRARTLAIALGDTALQVDTNTQLGVIYYHQGDYGRAIEVLRPAAMARACPSPHKRDDRPDDMVVWPWNWLLMSLSQVGAFAEGCAMRAEVLHLAEATVYPFCLAVATWGVGLLSLRQGDLSQAMAVFERGLALCHTHDLRDWLPTLASSVGYAYALAGRLPEALALLEQAVGQYMAMRGGPPPPTSVVWLGEAYLHAGRLEEAYAQGQRALVSSRTQQQRGDEAYALRLLGESHTRHTSRAVEPAAAHYRQALTLAEELGMRPLVAHCHRGLGTLYATVDQREQARTALTTAIEMYRAMDMIFWLPQAEAALAQVAAR